MLKSSFLALSLMVAASGTFNQHEERVCQVAAEVLRTLAPGFPSVVMARPSEAIPGPPRGGEEVRS